MKTYCLQQFSTGVGYDIYTASLQFQLQTTVCLLILPQYCTTQHSEKKYEEDYL